MKKRILIIISVIIWNLNTYSQTILKTIYFENGKIRTQGSIDTINKLRIGLWKSFYPKGEIRSLKKCKSNRPPNNIRFEAIGAEEIEMLKEMKDFICIKNGESIDYYKNGQISWKRTYIDGFLSGLEIEYYPNGNMKKVGKNNYKSNNFFANNPKSGKWKTYFENGNIKQIVTYDKGSLNGKIEIYYENGRINQKVIYKNNKKDGREKAYYENGKIRAILNFKLGIRIGSYQIFYDTEKLKVEYEYNNKGKLMNVINCYDKKGEILDFGTLKNGNGFVNFYDDLGKFKEKIEVINGIIQNK